MLLFQLCGFSGLLRQPQLIIMQRLAKGIIVFDVTMHMHKEVWEASDGEALMCDVEPDNTCSYDRCTTAAVFGKSIPDMEIVTSRVRYC